MSIEQSFVQWYQQLSQNDQQALSSFIAKNFCASQRGAVAPRFGGRQVGSIGASAKKPARLECPYCHNQIEIR